LDYLPDAKKKELKLTGAENFTYCNKGGCVKVEGLNDESDMKDFMVGCCCIDLYRCVHGS
jgi:myosin heavy subunit